MLRYLLFFYALFLLWKILRKWFNEKYCRKKRQTSGARMVPSALIGSPTFNPHEQKWIPFLFIQCIRNKYIWRVCFYRKLRLWYFGRSTNAYATMNFDLNHSARLRFPVWGDTPEAGVFTYLRYWYWYEAKTALIRTYSQTNKKYKNVPGAGGHKQDIWVDSRVVRKMRPGTYNYILAQPQLNFK